MPPASRRFLGLLLAQVVQTGLIHSLVPDAQTTFSWILFLYGTPLALAGAILAHQRWAFAGGVIYATVGLALDIATIVFGITHEQPLLSFMLGYGVSAAINLAVIVAGGHAFLSVTQAARPPATRLPNPPSRLST